MPRRKARKAAPKTTQQASSLRQTTLSFVEPNEDGVGAERASVDGLRTPAKISDASAMVNVRPPSSAEHQNDVHSHSSPNTSSSDADSVNFSSELGENDRVKFDSPLKRDLSEKDYYETAEKPVSPNKRERLTPPKRMETKRKEKLENTYQLTKPVNETSGKKPARRSQSASSCRQRRPQKDKTPVMDAYNLDAYFPTVRRSSRREEKIIKEIHDRDFTQKVVNGVEEGLKICEFEDKGRGIIATRQFSANDFVIEYAGELVSATEAEKRNKSYGMQPEVGCYMFWLNHKGKKYCVDATAESGRLGRLINHSRTQANLRPKVKEIDGEPRLLLYSTRQISAGEELLYDYGDRCKETLENFPWLKT